MSVQASSTFKTPAGLLPRRAKWGVRIIILAIVIAAGVVGLAKVGATVLVADAVASFRNGEMATFQSEPDSTYLVLVNGDQYYDRETDTLVHRNAQESNCEVSGPDGDNVALNGVGQVLKVTTMFGESVGTFTTRPGLTSVTCVRDVSAIITNLQFDEFGFRVVPINTTVVTAMQGAVVGAVVLALFGAVLLFTGLRGRRMTDHIASQNPQAAQAMAAYEAHLRQQTGQPHAVPGSTDTR